jgi:hypothetical protein
MLAEAQSDPPTYIIIASISNRMGFNFQICEATTDKELEFYCDQIIEKALKTGQNEVIEELEYFAGSLV